MPWSTEMVIEHGFRQEGGCPARRKEQANGTSVIQNMCFKSYVEIHTYTERENETEIYIRIDLECCLDDQHVYV